MKRFFTLLLAAFLCCTWSTARADELVIADGTSPNTVFPINGVYADYYQHVQIIYPAADLEDMIGSEITQITFYNQTQNTTYGAGVFEIGLKEVAEANLGDGTAFNGATPTIVYTGSLSIVEKLLAIELDNPYIYNGGNLLFDLKITTKGSMVSGGYYGVADALETYHCVEGHSSIGLSNITAPSNKAKFIPKTTFTYSSKTSCEKPTDVVASAVTSTTAIISWEKGAAESSIVEYKLHSSAEWTKVEDATSPLVLENLTPNSDYDVRVTNSCGEEGLSHAVNIQISTICEPLSAKDYLPYEMDFEDVQAGAAVYYNIPDCWHKIAHGNYPYVSVNTDYVTAHGGNQCLYFSGGNEGTDCMIILPQFETPYTGLTLSFWYINSSTYSFYGQGKIGYITDIKDKSTFVVLKKLDRVDTYTLVENFSLEEAPAGSFIAIQYSGGTFSYDGRFLIDDLVVASTAPSCPKPSDLEVSEISMTSAIISWTKGEADASVLEYKASAEAEWTSLGTQESPYNLTGLTRNSSYDVRVKNACGGLEDSKYISTSFSTVCGIFSADSEHPFVENFDEIEISAIPECWDKSEKSSYSPEWGVSIIDKHGSSGRSARFNYALGSNGEYNILKTPAIYISSLATVSFWYKNTGSGVFSAYYSIDGGEPVELVGGASSIDEWTKFETELPKACVKHHVTILFKGLVNTAVESAIFVDDLVIECAETCPAPTNLTVGNETASGADFSWDAGGTESQWQYLCLPADAEVDWTSEAVKTVTTNSVTVNGLNPATDYTFYLRADCGSEDGVSLDISQDFHTECLAEITSLTCDFEEAEGYKKGEYPECWIARYSSTPVYTPVITDEGTPYSGDQHLYMHGGERQYIILPRFEQEVKSLQVSFSFMKNNDTWFSVGSMTDPDNISTFYSIEVFSGTGYERKTEYVLSGARTGDHYLVFLFYPLKTTAELYLDDIVVEKAPTCFAPTNVRTASAPTENSAELTWTPTSAESNWVLQTSQDGIDWSADKEVSELPCTLTGLNASTSYFVRVKAVCSEEESSEWSEIFEFRTACDGSINVPWTETFEGMADEIVPYCWDNSASTSLLSEKTDPTAVWCTFTLYGNTIIGMWDEYVDEGTVQINTPTINLPASPEQALTFDYTNTTTADIKLDVKISKDGGSTFEQIGQYGNKKDLEPIEEAINLGKYAGKSVIIQFFAEAVSEGEGAIILDNVKIDKSPGAPTYIDETEAAVKALKLLRDGQLIIIRNGVNYNAQGTLMK